MKPDRIFGLLILHMYLFAGVPGALAQHARDSTVPVRLHKSYISSEAFGWIRGGNVNFEFNVGYRDFSADYLRLWIYSYHDEEFATIIPEYGGRWGHMLAGFYSLVNTRHHLQFEGGIGLFAELGDPVARVNYLYGGELNRFSPGLMGCLALRYVFPRFPLQLRMSVLPAYKVRIASFYPYLSSVSVGWGFSRLSNATHRWLPLIKKSRTNHDSLFSRFRVTLSGISTRVYSPWAIGLEKLTDIGRSSTLSTQMFWSAGLTDNIFRKQDSLNMAYLAFGLQPAHFVFGTRWQFEVGASLSYQLYRLYGQKLDIRGLYEDKLTFQLSAGGRYSFSHSPLEVRIIVGPAYAFFVQSAHWGWLNSQHAELSLILKLRRPESVRQ